VNIEELDNMKYLSFSTGGYPSGYRTIEIENLGEKAICKYYPPRIKKGQKEKIFEIPIGRWNAFLKTLIIDLNILSWKENYNNDDIIDGEQWEIRMKFINGNQVKIDGSNDYPIEWDKYIEVINEYFPIFNGGIKIMENGKVYVVHNEWLQDPETGEMPYKIGITKSTVDHRYYGLGLKMPGEFICDFAYEFDETYTKVEQTLHSMLNQLNVNGEWFNINEDALVGIKSICELAGGKLITERIETEIEVETGEIPDPRFEKIVNNWNSISALKAEGQSSRKKSIHIPEINKPLYYAFRVRNQKEIAIELGCFTKSIPNFDMVLKSLDGLVINGNTFNYLKLSAREIKLGYKGRIRTIILIDEIDNIINTMKMLIENTKEKIIGKYNEENI
jgi:hypothetical protein